MKKIIFNNFLNFKKINFVMSSQIGDHFKKIKIKSKFSYRPDMNVNF
jgi:hypothetical protein